MTDNIDGLFKGGLEKVKPGTEMMQQDWEAMKSLLLTVPGHKGKTSGNIIGKKIFFAISIASVVLVAVYLLLSNKKTIQQNVTTATVKASTLVPQQFSQPQKKDTGLTLTSGNIAKNKTDNSPKPNFIQVDTTRVKETARQDSAAAILVDNPIAKSKTDAEILDSFYNLLKTPTQFFVIDNTKDTTIVGKDGSEITIPANSFITKDSVAVTGKITLLLDECYSYTDIVANKLHTLSNGNLLQSGGMLHIKAVAKGKNLMLNKTKLLLAKMPTKKFDENMQLFVQKKEENKDTALQINWMQAGQSQIFTPLPMVQVLNLEDDYYEMWADGDKLIGKFIMPRKCKLSKEEMIAELKRRYYYTKVKIRRCDSAAHSYKFSFLTNWAWGTKEGPVVGDSIDVSPTTADRLKLWGVGQKERYNKMLEADSAYRGAISKLENKYNFSISNLGWINCDHFYDDPRPKVRYVLNVKDNAQNYISQIIFLNCRLMMPAQISGNYISFAGISEGEPVQLVSIGVKNGKVVASVQKFTVSKAVVNNVVYQEVGAEDLKKQLRLSDIK